jgi:hypothetical protein
MIGIQIFINQHTEKKHINMGRQETALMDGNRSHITEFTNKIWRQSGEMPVRQAVMRSVAAAEPARLRSAAKQS